MGLNPEGIQPEYVIWFCKSIYLRVNTLDHPLAAVRESHVSSSETRARSHLAIATATPHDLKIGPVRNYHSHCTRPTFCVAAVIRLSV